MNTRLIGFATSIAAFFVVGCIVNATLGSSLSLVSAIAAAYFTWRHFKNQDVQEVMQMLAEKEQTWQLPYNVSYAAIKDTLARITMTSPGGGLCKWQLVKEDEREGNVVAICVLQERYTNNQVQWSVPVTVAANFHVQPDGNQTKVSWYYEAHCPLSARRLKETIHMLEQCLFHTVKQRQLCSAAAS